MVAVRSCEMCGKTIQGRSDKKYCSPSCRAKARARKMSSEPEHIAASSFEPPSGLSEGDLFDTVRSRLDRAGRLDGVEGQQALVLARQLSAKVAVPSGLASLSRELSRVMDAALAGTEPEKEDVVDELASRRESLLREARERAAGG